MRHSLRPQGALGQPPAARAGSLSPPPRPARCFRPLPVGSGGPHISHESKRWDLDHLSKLVHNRPGALSAQRAKAAASMGDLESLIPETQRTIGAMIQKVRAQAASVLACLCL